MKVKLALASIFVAIFLVFNSSCNDQPYKHGEILYNNFCASCHMKDGTGLLGNIPPLKGADYVKEAQEQIACIIRNGQKGEIVVNGKTYNQSMPGIPQLTAAEVTNVINYINNSWGNDYGTITLEQVNKEWETCPIEY